MPAQDAGPPGTGEHDKGGLDWSVKVTLVFLLVLAIAVTTVAAVDISNGEDVTAAWIGIGVVAAGVVWITVAFRLRSRRLRRSDNR